MAKISPLQMYESQDHSGLTTKNHLGYNFAIEPQKAAKTATMIYQANYGDALSAYLEKFSKINLETDDDFEWDLVSNGKKNIPLTRAEISPGSTASASDKLGVNVSVFYLVFPEKYFADAEVIVGERNELYPIKILEEPQQVGDGYRYKCELLTGDRNLFIPYQEVKAGKRFSKEWAPVSKTMSVKGGGVNYTFPFKMRNALTMIRLEDTVPGNMIKRPVRFSWKNNKGKVMTTWMDYRSYQMEMEWQSAINKLLHYATANKADDGSYLNRDKSGYQLEQGAGIKQQMEASNYYTYNKFNIDKFIDMLVDLTSGKIPQGQRKLAVRTGERGMIQFHRALEDKANLFTPNNTAARIYMKNGSTLGYRGQFLEYIGPNGIEVTIMHDPLKDDLERNKIYMPGQAGLAESYVYDILSMKTSEGKDNIQKMIHDDGRGYESGLRNPFDYGKNTLMSNPKDAWTEHRWFIGGSVVFDPTRTATYKPIVL